MRPNVVLNIHCIPETISYPYRQRERENIMVIMQYFICLFVYLSNYWQVSSLKHNTKDNFGWINSTVFINRYLSLLYSFVKFKYNIQCEWHYIVFRIPKCFFHNIIACKTWKIMIEIIFLILVIKWIVLHSFEF